MKLLLKIVLFVLVTLVVNVDVTSATITFGNNQEVEAHSSFHKETTKTVRKDIKNDVANCCQSHQDLVIYRNWGTGVEVVAAKGGSAVY